MTDERHASTADAVERGPEVERDREPRVRERAYMMWEQEGRPDGRSVDHWPTAKRELEAEMGPDAELAELERGHIAEDEARSADPAVKVERRARLVGVFRASELARTLTVGVRI